MLEVVQKPPAQEKSKYTSQLLSTKELVDKYWGQCIPLFQACFDRAMDGEMTIDDLYSRVLQGQTYLIVFKDDELEVPEVRLAMAMEVGYYPQYNVMNISAIGGKDLKYMIKHCYRDIVGWAKVCGVTKMECLASPAIEKILSAEGFKRKYIMLRHDLTEVI